jgi:hypothetical protein
MQNSIKIISNPSIDLWKDCKETIRTRCQSDPLFKNYIDIDPDRYYHFVTAVYKNTIISFGAIEYSPHKWGEKIARVLTRFWIHPDFRSNGLTKWGFNNVRFSPIILDAQLKFLKTQNKIEVAMITREGEFPNSFKKITELASSVSDDPFEILEKIYNVCGDSTDSSCYQMIALSSISEEDKWKVFSEAISKGFFKGPIL